jgi:extracellular elastinolytic metalloproteinase
MYIWPHTTVSGPSSLERIIFIHILQPNRDGSLENDIVGREITTNRTTGGGTGRCLQTTEAGGIGEGWSDALAEWTERKSGTITDYVLGDYVTDNANGIRTAPYSTSM